MLGGILVALNYVRYHNANAIAQYESLHGLGETTRPPFVGKVEEDLVATNWGEENVRLVSLRGDVWVGALAYTDCPEDCRELVTQMKQAGSVFEGEDRLHMVLFSLDSVRDIPAKVAAFGEEMSLSKDRWFYLTSPEVNLEDYVREWVLLQPAKPVLDEAGQPTGVLRQDTRVFLIDGKANLRGYYSLLDPEIGDRELERLQKDIQYILDHEIRKDPESDSSS